MVSKERVRGFTLIELLVVVAIIGIIAAILIPNLLDALQKARQKRTMADMRNSGTMWFSWLTDQVGAAASGRATVDGNLVDWSAYVDKPYAELKQDLVPLYAAELPELDGWRTTFQYGTLALDLPRSIAIRSAGSDGVFESEPYSIGAFVATDYERDIVWAGGFFIQWPGGITGDAAPATPP
jgi:prepilin-type N-terminal cleavage/methylation domain-containing protein